jgi:ATPase subunit of ABC transporter with duplicated ATPase domains
MNTDNLNLISRQALRDSLETFDGTVLAVIRDRWFAARSFDRYPIFTADGYVKEETGN